ncbi:MAG: GntR family transcriptional regulator [Leifsonia flava]
MARLGATDIGDRREGTVLDRDAGPLYAQIRDHLLGQINARELAPGSPLPTEEELQQLFGVSRSVVRQALGELADRGLIIKQRGRGSVVVPAIEHHRRANQAGGLRQQLASAGQDLQTRVLLLERRDPPRHVVEQLDTGAVWYLERLRSVQDEALIYMQTWVPADLFPDLDRAALDNGSLHDAMRSTGIHPEGGQRHVEAVPADPMLAAHLHCRESDPIMLMRGVTRDRTGRGLESFSAWHRPGTVFDIDAHVNDAQPMLERLERAGALLAEAEQLLKGTS